MFPSHELSDHADGLSLIDANEAFVLVSGNIVVLILEVDECHLLVVFHQDKPIAEDFLSVCVCVQAGVLID